MNKNIYEIEDKVRTIINTLREKGYINKYKDIDNETFNKIVDIIIY